MPRINMIGPSIALVLLSLALIWTVFAKGGVYPSDWSVTLLAVGGTASFYSVATDRRSRVPALGKTASLLIVAVPCYVGFQLLPLPLPILRILSPARESLAVAISSINSTISRAPLSVNPPAALLSLFTVVGYIVTFLLVRELAWRFRPGVWIPVIPLLFIAGVEAIIGVVQVGVGWPSAVANGTYVNRDHFCGLLELILPLSVVCGLGILRKDNRRYRSSVQIAVKVCAAWTVSVVSFVAIVYSTSRAGFVVALASLFVVVALERRVKFASLWICILLIPLAFFLLTTDPLLERFADKMAGEARPYIWKETLSLITEFRWFGCGLGGFASTFLKYQGHFKDFSIQFAHNDYLQYLAELGIVGFSILSAAFMGVLWPIFGGLQHSGDEDRRLLTVGVTGSIVAIGLHSLVDFNMYIPANAMTLAWIVGLGSAHITVYKRSEETPGAIMSAERAHFVPKMRKPFKRRIDEYRSVEADR